MYNNPLIDVFLDHNVKLYKMIEIYLKYDNMHTFGIINAFICINNHVNSFINSMLSESTCPSGAFNLDYYNSPEKRMTLNHL